MIGLLATALGLGIAGIDPAGALLAIAALARGVSARAVIGYAAIVVLGTAALGSALSLLVGKELAAFDWGDLLIDGDLGAVIELAIAAALLGWAAVRLRRPGARPGRPPSERNTGGAGLLGLGVLFAAAAVTDPTFVGLVVVAGRDEPAAAVVLAHLLWITVSQVPLVVLASAVALGAHDRVVARFERIRERVAPVARVALTAALALAGSFMVADALSQLITGRFLVGN